MEPSWIPSRNSSRFVHVLGSLGTQFGRFLEPQVLVPVPVPVRKNEIGIWIFYFLFFNLGGGTIQTQKPKIALNFLFFSSH